MSRDLQTVALSGIEATPVTTGQGKARMCLMADVPFSIGEVTYCANVIHVEEVRSSFWVTPKGFRSGKLRMWPAARVKAGGAH
jgi:hypothetical protein